MNSAKRIVPKDNKVAVLEGGGLTSRVAAGVSCWRRLNLEGCWWRRLSLEYVETAVNIDEVRTIANSEYR